MRSLNSSGHWRHLMVALLLVAICAWIVIQRSNSSEYRLEGGPASTLDRSHPSIEEGSASAEVPPRESRQAEGTGVNPPGYEAAPAPLRGTIVVYDRAGAQSTPTMGRLYWLVRQMADGMEAEEGATVEDGH